jgi:hypothetical protein
MIPFSNDFIFAPLERTDTPTGRKYQTPSGDLVSSVTTILSATQSEESKNILKQWRDRVGDQEADRITKNATDIGTLLHNQLENYLLQKPVEWKTNMLHQLTRKMFSRVVEELHNTFKKFILCIVSLSPNSKV